MLWVFAGILAIASGYACGEAPPPPPFTDINQASKEQLAQACSTLALGNHGDTAEIFTGVHGEIIPAKGSHHLSIKKLQEAPRGIARVRLLDPGTYPPFNLTGPLPACWFIWADSSKDLHSTIVSIDGTTLTKSMTSHSEFGIHWFHEEAHWVPVEHSVGARLDPRPTPLHAEELRLPPRTQADTAQGMLLALAQSSCSKSSCCYPR